MSATPRNYGTPDEIHMEPAEIHDPTNTVPAYAAELEAALSRVARQDCSGLGGTNYQVAQRRIERENDTRFAHARWPTHE